MKRSLKIEGLCIAAVLFLTLASFIGYLAWGAYHGSQDDVKALRSISISVLITAFLVWLTTYAIRVMEDSFDS